LNRTKNETENPNATAMNAGVVAVGGDKIRLGAFLGSADRS